VYVKIPQESQVYSTHIMLLTCYMRTLALAIGNVNAQWHKSMGSFTHKLMAQISCFPTTSLSLFSPPCTHSLLVFLPHCVWTSFSITTTGSLPVVPPSLSFVFLICKIRKSPTLSLLDKTNHNWQYMFFNWPVVVSKEWEEYFSGQTHLTWANYSPWIVVSNQRQRSTFQRKA
jgi:hypothetical protein